MNKKRQEKARRSMLWFWTSGSERNRACEKVRESGFNFACCISGIVCTVNESMWVSFSKRKKKKEESKWVRKSVNTEESFMKERGIEWIEVVAI